MFLTKCVLNIFTYQLTWKTVSACGWFNWKTYIFSVFILCAYKTADVCICMCRSHIFRWKLLFAWTRWLIRQVVMWVENWGQNIFPPVRHLSMMLFYPAWDPEKMSLQKVGGSSSSLLFYELILMLKWQCVIKVDRLMDFLGLKQVEQDHKFGT